MCEAIGRNLPRVFAHRVVLALCAAVLTAVAGLHDTVAYGRPVEPPTNTSATSAAQSERLPASLPLIRNADDPVTGGGARWTALGVLAVFACAGTVLVRLRRGRRRSGKAVGAPVFGWAGMNSDKPARVVQSMRLTGKASAHVVQWNGRQWLIACTDQAVTVLGAEGAEPRNVPTQPDAEAG